MPVKSKYTKEFVKQIVISGRMLKRSDLQKANGAAYNVARKERWLDELFGPPQTRGKITTVSKEKRKVRKARKVTAGAAPASVPQNTKRSIMAIVTIVGIKNLDGIGELIDTAESFGGEVNVRLVNE